MGFDPILWPIPWAIAAGAWAVCYRRGFDMSGQHRWRAASVWFFIGFVPFGVVSLWWSTMSNPAPNIRWAVLGVVGAAVGASAFITIGEMMKPSPAYAQASSPPGVNSDPPARPEIGDRNTMVNVPVPKSMGSGNTFVGPTDQHGNTIYNKGGTAIGEGACADSTSIAIGAGANAGGCAKKP